MVAVGGNSVSEIVENVAWKVNTFGGWGGKPLKDPVTPPPSKKKIPFKNPPRKNLVLAAGLFPGARKDYICGKGYSPGSTTLKSWGGPKNLGLPVPQKKRGTHKFCAGVKRGGLVASTAWAARSVPEKIGSPINGPALTLYSTDGGSSPLWK